MNLMAGVIIILQQKFPSNIITMSFSAEIMKKQKYTSQDIVKKCKKYPEFMQELYDIQVAYAQDLNMALYSNLQEIEDLGVFHLQQEPTLVFSFFAYLMPTYEEYASKFYLLWIKILDEQLRKHVGKKFNIIYYHTFCESNYPYNFMVGIFKKLPLYYYAMVDKIYTVESTYFLRKTAGLFDFGRLYKLFERKLQNIEKIIQFIDIPEISKNNILQKLPQRLFNHVQEKSKKKLMKQKNIHPDMSKIQSSKKDVDPKKPIIKLDFLTIQLTLHKLNSEELPISLVILINTFKTYPHLLDLEGIFRKSGSIEEQQEIIVQLAKLNGNQTLKDVTSYSGFALAGVIKKFFTKLITPIVPYQVYTNILSITSQSVIKPEEQVTFVLDFLNQLPNLNKKIILYLMKFLKRQVISRQQMNKMNNYNMSVCFCPCLFRSQSPTLADLLNSGKFAGILNIFFTKFDEIIVIQERSSKDKEKIEKTVKLGNKNLLNFRISMA